MFRIFFSARLPSFGAKIMHDWVSLCAFIAPTLIRLQFHCFLGVLTLSLNIFLKLALSWLLCCVGSQACGSEDRKDKTIHIIDIYLCESKLLALQDGRGLN